MNDKIKYQSATSMMLGKSCSGVCTKGVSGINIFSTLAFVLFPKCAMCWTAYASLFSVIGLEQIGFNPQLKYAALSILVIGSAFVIYKHIKQQAWLNLILYGSALIVLTVGYLIEPQSNWWLYLVSVLMLLSTFTRLFSKNV